MQGGERLPAAVFCHGTEGADIGFAPKHLEAGHPELDIGIRAGDRIVEVDDAVVGVDDVDRRIGQAVEDVAGGFVTFAQKAGGAALPDVLPDDFGHEDEGVHFLLCPYAAVAALLEADMADHVPSRTMSHWRSEEMVSSRMNVFSSGGTSEKSLQ